MSPSFPLQRKVNSSYLLPVTLMSSTWTRTGRLWFLAEWPSCRPRSPSTGSFPPRRSRPTERTSFTTWREALCICSLTSATRGWSTARQRRGASLRSPSSTSCSTRRVSPSRARRKPLPAGQCRVWLSPVVAGEQEAQMVVLKGSSAALSFLECYTLLPMIPPAPTPFSSASSNALSGPGSACVISSRPTSPRHPPALSILAAGARGGGWGASPPTSRREGTLASPAREERRDSLLFSLGALWHEPGWWSSCEAECSAAVFPPGHHCDRMGGSRADCSLRIWVPSWLWVSALGLIHEATASNTAVK